MPDSPPNAAPLPALVAVAVGNTRTRVGTFVGAELTASGSHENTDPRSAGEAVREACRTLAQRGDGAPVVVLSSVAPPAADALLADLRAAPPAGEIFRFGTDLPIPIRTALAPDVAQRTGHDRLLDALGAYALVAQACIVVDLGTAITVDFVDGEGTFHGGSIAPGLRLMLDALHRGTAQLPPAPFALPDPALAWGADTESAMNLGVLAAARGMVRWAVERAAVAYGSYPLVLATGGDAGVLEEEGLVDRFVPDLQLIGIREACRLALHDEA